MELVATYTMDLVSTCSETCSTSAEMPSKGAEIARGRLNCPLFTIPRLFRNQQVAGSIPAGGSSLKSGV
jgi:hypothetical protein